MDAVHDLPNMRTSAIFIGKCEYHRGPVYGIHAVAGEIRATRHAGTAFGADFDAGVLDPASIRALLGHDLLELFHGFFSRRERCARLHFHLNARLSDIGEWHHLASDEVIE